MKAFAAAILATAAVALKIKEPTYSDVKSHVEKYGVPSDIEAAQEYDLPTYSEAKAHVEKYGVPSDLEAA